MAATLSGCMASTQQEVQLGTQYAQQINAQLPIIQDAEVVRYINALGNKLASQADDRGLTWRFHVVNDRDINAFAVPGGYIYVNRGLIERAQNLSQLAGVLGHEISHVTERHSMEQMRDAERANLGVGVLCTVTSVCSNQAAAAAIQLGGSAAFAKFSRSDEAEADARGIEIVRRAGIHPQGIPDMFRILLQMRSSSPSSVNSWFASHPLEEDRIEATEAQIARIPAAQLRGLTKDDQAFQRFKSRVRSLPTATSARR
jgi:predicted Zn-dependent protease